MPAYIGILISASNSTGSGFNLRTKTKDPTATKEFYRRLTGINITPPIDTKVTG
jgi:hypothetical protein